MKLKAAFTLTEMLAVMGIALVLMATTVGVLVAVAGHIGPEYAAMTLQSVLNGARAYAASKGLPARVVVQTSLTKMDGGSIMTIEYKEPKAGWVRVPNVEPIHLGQGMFILKGLPSGLASLRSPALPVNPQAPTPTEQTAWNTYRSDVFSAVANHAFGSGVTAQGLITAIEFAGSHATFYVYFAPEGYLALQADQSDNTEALTIIQITGRRLSEYLFYPLNPNTGTRLVFE